MIQTLKLEKLFGYRRAVRPVTLTIDAGEIVALVGPNGAGKSTLLRMLATLMRPTRGLAAINGIEVPAGAMEARPAIGYVGHQTLMYDDLTVEENLRFYGRLYAIDQIEQRISQVARQLGIEKRLNDVTRTLSRGYQQRAALARALLHHPSVYLYDEPQTGLDQESSTLLDKLFLNAKAEGAAVLFSTHDFPRGLATAERAIILRDGKLVYDGRRDDWRDAAGFAAIYAEQIQP
jgi:heme ABC exporter ATP-binding subunit CcmA